uniref:AT-hook motif nuclear-localized protein n=1 Tax=Angiostrongylus cantonensis TaxID=6313 RepID=A0A0K0CY86_ANGCA
MSTTTAPASITQNESAVGSLKPSDIPRPVLQAREGKAETPVPTQLSTSASAASPLPVSAEPPTLPSNKNTVNTPTGRHPPSRAQKKPTGKRKTQWVVGSTGSSVTTGTVLSMSSPTVSQRMNADDDSKLETAKVNLFWLHFLSFI